MFTFKNYFNETEFKVLSVVTRKGIIFWDLTPCHSVKLHWCFGKLLPPSTELKRKQSKSHHDSMFIFIYIYLPDLLRLASGGTWHPELCCNVDCWLWLLHSTPRLSLCQSWSRNAWDAYKYHCKANKNVYFL